MKKIVFSFVALACFACFGYSQNYDNLKNQVLLGQVKEAKEELDKKWTNAKFVAKPEAYILKSTIYTKMAVDPAMADKEEENRNIALENFNKYKEMDPTMALLKDPVYANTEATLFNAVINSGIKKVTSDKWDAALADFKISSDLSDHLIKEKQITWTFDTISNYYGGIAAQNAGKLDEAERLYKKVADQKIAGPDYVNMYRFLMFNSFQKGNTADFEKYRALGHELYPNEEYFTASEMDFILSLDDDKAKFQKIDEKLAKEPNNAKLQETYGLILFDKLNKGDDASAMTAAERAELENKMANAFTKSAELDPASSAKGYFYLGNHYINKSVEVGTQMDSVTDQIKAFNKTAKPDKTGKLPPAPKELTDKRAALSAAYDAELEKGLPYLTKSAEAYGKQTNLGSIDKQNYKKLVDQLIIIYGNKAIKAKVPADKAKFAAEEKKWTDVYSGIK
jgi:hypothetical protein